MGGAIAGSKQRFAREIAEQYAQYVFDVLKPLCEKVVVCGSIRRLRPDVGDIDIAVIPKGGEPTIPWAEDVCAAIKMLVATRGGAFSQGPTVKERKNVYRPRSGWNFSLMTDGGPIQVDLIHATELTMPGLLIALTGPAAFNIRLSMKMQKEGWKFGRYGVTDREGKPVEARNERELMESMGVAWLEPMDRDEAARKRL